MYHHQGQFGLLGGTSASGRIFEVLINRLVEELLAVGKGSLGFINPILYQNSEAFIMISKTARIRGVGQTSAPPLPHNKGCKPQYRANQVSVPEALIVWFSNCLCHSPPRMLQDLVNVRSLSGVQPRHVGDHVLGFWGEVRRIIH